MARMFYDEMHDAGGECRSHYREFARWLADTPEEQVLQRRREADLLFHRAGITFTLYGDEQGTERLLSSPWCENQGFSWGGHVLGLQGHPEMTEELVRRWIAGWPHLLDPSQPSQQSAEDMLAGLPARIAGLNRVAEGFYRHWLSLID